MRGWTWGVALLGVLGCQAEPTALDGQAPPPVRASAGAWRLELAELGEAVAGAQVVVRGRADRALQAVQVQWADGSAGLSRPGGGAGRFDVSVRAGSELSSALSGEPMGLRLVDGVGQVAAARVGFDVALAELVDSPNLRVSPDVLPVYLRGPADPLRYRVRVQVTPGSVAELVLATGGPAPRRALGPGRFGFDLSEAQLVGTVLSGFRSLGLVSSNAAGMPNGAASARPALRVRSVALVEGAGPAGAPLSCDPAVYACAWETMGEDLSVCGSYAEVARCVEADACAVEEEAAPEWSPLDATGLEEPSATYLAGCNGGGVWCGLDGLLPYRLAGCPVVPWTLERVVGLALASPEAAGWAGFGFADGELLDLTALRGTPTFGTSYSAGGAVLLATVLEQVGSESVQAWTLSAPVPCPNCTEVEDLLVLWFPEVRRAVVVLGRHGFDS
jgi:hypothetical protein